MPAARKTTARKTSPKTAASDTERPAPLVDLAEDPFDESAVGQLFLFELNGVDYYIPDACNANVLAEAARLEREKGQSAATWWLLEEFTGAEGVAALRAYRGMTKDHLAQLYQACVKVLTGPKA